MAGQGSPPGAWIACTGRFCDIFGTRPPLDGLGSVFPTYCFLQVLLLLLLK